MGMAPSSVTEWKWWSPHHIQSAALFARLAFRIESTAHWSDEPRVIEHRAYVTGTIFACVAFLEATINELYAESAAVEEIEKQQDPWNRGPYPYGPAMKLPAKVRAALAAVSPPPQFLKNYQTALSIAGAQQFDQSSVPYQPVDELRALRNELLHYKPRWETTLHTADASKVSRRNFYGKFPTNRMVPDNMPENLDKHLGHGCAAWAVKSSLTFSDEFYTRLNLISLYDHLRTTFGTE